MKADEQLGVYRKYNVERTDGSSKPGGKHEDCRYYVLDLDHDPHAYPALMAYIESCQEQFPGLAADLRRIIGEGALTARRLIPAPAIDAPAPKEG